ncbi:hypothetical protein OC846_000285 [Tilletia horrida]|uniref:FHA domain-containing protein n=1 Tax=Tilletia horrida TaxID=155126 RepID=A0AAN6GW49_9BASI|nr:hypothetical protein OC845_002973 [Tilletia horrida]KAK0557718.1 hypothetical protein OC846_000285 [Tilletia horrida]
MPDRGSRWDSPPGEGRPANRDRREERHSDRPSANSSRRRYHDDEPSSSSRKREHHDDRPSSRYSRHDDDDDRSRRRYDDSRSRNRSRSPDPRSSRSTRPGPGRPPSYADRGPAPDFERDRRNERARYDSSIARDSNTRPNGDAQTGSAEAGGDGGGPPAEANFAPDFGSSGLLAAASNNVEGIALKYHEPPEARKPKPGKGWRLYVFKDGKDVDIPIDHPSASKQHAVIQFRQVTERNEFGDEQRRIQPFLIDLESSNGSYLNGAEVPTSRYVELKSGDTLKFGASAREWVLLPEDAA